MRRITIVAPESKQGEPALELACSKLSAALCDAGLDASCVWPSQHQHHPQGDVVVVRTRDCGGAETCRILSAQSDGRRVLTVEGDDRSVAYGLFRLAERVRLGQDLWRTEGEHSPAFPLRIFSEQGGLLDIPDIGYYSDETPYVNETILRQELDELKRLLPHLVEMGYNAFAVLNPNVEEYVDYGHLDKPVYAPDDPHRIPR